MTNATDISKNILAAIAALAVTGMCVFGTVGPVPTDTGAQPVQLQSEQDGIIIVSGQIA